MLLFSRARLLSRIYLGQKAIISDEIVFVVGLVLCLAFVALTIACVSRGTFGRHAWNVLLGAFTKAQLVQSLLVEILLPLALCFVKNSLLILYLKIFSLLRWIRIATILGIVVITAFYLSLSIAFASMCSPSTGASQLDFLYAFVSDTCSRTRILVVTQGVGNVLTDLFLLILPMPAVWALQMPLKRKLAVSAMFSIGICACASSILGLVYRTQYYTAGEDNIPLVVPLWTTSIAEETAGVMICCMPSVAAVFKAVKGPVQSWLSSVSERVLHITDSSGFGTLLSGRNSNLKRSLGRNKYESSQNPIYCHPSPCDRHNAWVHTDVDACSLRDLDPGDTGIGKKTEVKVTQAV
ncbi:hypothetical protein F4818DRAFT_180413 [Hypoxylon cercidicola]|nr:hypothetical protein F4818DRAFT_180413 [Hypoxylon cercidicola]